MNVLVTGAAGFIGFHLSRLLCKQGIPVVGIDNLNDYYSVQLKKDRLAQLQPETLFTFHELDLSDQLGMTKLFKDGKFTHVVNLAAQAGVRYSLVNPHAYVMSNQLGFLNILEGCRHNPVEHLIFASSSSVYGLNKKMPYCVDDGANHPVSLYAATKKSNEMMAHSYSHLYGIPATGLRFFTVYGPWGRPDMAPHIFSQAILSGQPIPLFNRGDMRRDFTYIDDIVEGVFRLLRHAPSKTPEWDAVSATPSSSSAPYALYNIGNNKTVQLKYFVEVLEKCLGVKASLDLLPMQPGDVQETYADIDSLAEGVGFSPRTTIEEGVEFFARWHRDYYGV